MTLYRDEVLANRQKWAEFLTQPERKKAFGLLEKIDDNEARCCLGHACHVLGETRSENKYLVSYGNEAQVAPVSLMIKLGLWTGTGANTGRGPLSIKNQPSLASLNDYTDATPQEIGAYLKTVIQGGAETPFKPLDQYPERNV